MAQIWTDIASSMNNEIYPNAQVSFQFEWDFVTFSNETQDAGELRWRKLNSNTSVQNVGVYDWMRNADSLWTTPSVQVGRFEDTTTWTLSGGQYVPPVDADRRYSNITHVDFPVGFFSPGVYAFQARMKPTGQEWSTWYLHRVEISEYADRQTFITSSTGAVRGPAFPNEGTYGVRVEAVSAAGVSAVSAEQQFNVWQTDKYIKDSGNIVRAIPENTFTDKVVRIRR